MPTPCSGAPSCFWERLNNWDHVFDWRLNRSPAPFSSPFLIHLYGLNFKRERKSIPEFIPGICLLRNLIMPDFLQKNDQQRNSPPEWFMDAIMEELFRQRKLDLKAYRRKTLERRLQKLMKRPNMQNPENYLLLLHNNAEECDHLIDALTIQVSSFFRNPIVWEIMAQTLIPEIIQVKKDAGSREIRIWSAGCAGGEEAYSAAILVNEAVQNEIEDWNIHIFATDISPQALKDAEAGRYAVEKLEHTKLGILDKYFTRAGAGYAVSAQIRNMVSFSIDDLTSMDRLAPAASVFGSFDFIFCRNVLIYFSLDLQQRVLIKLSDSLAKGGWLLLGDTESVTPNLEQRLTPVDRINRIFQRSQ